MFLPIIKHMVMYKEKKLIAFSYTNRNTGKEIMKHFHSQ